MKVVLFCFLLLGPTFYSKAQTTVNLLPDSLEMAVETKYHTGFFYVPKTAAAQDDFLNNGIHYNSIRTNVIESALNNSNDYADCIAFIQSVGSILQDLAAKTDRLIFIFEKMPAWLSSSNDGSPAQTPGWYVLNTKPPSNYSNWNSMVEGVIDQLFNQLSIQNAAFEIWNEPDIGSWTGTDAEYFELFENTYQSIKNIDNSIPVGGPATNFWGNHINYQPPYGYIPPHIGDNSLIGALIDSTVSWNKPLDFISWHQFNISFQSSENAIEYIQQKYASLGHPKPELILSEWNTPSAVRDTPIQKAFFIKNQIEMAKTSIQYNCIAAWQDFEQSTTEFHQDYGLLTYGSIYKPAYNALLLSNKLNGSSISYNTNAHVDLLVTLSSDTLSVLLSNFVPPPFVEAFNHTLFEGKLNINQLDSMGLISIANNNIEYLDSIYKGFYTLSNSNPIHTAVNNAISIYQHYDSLQSSNRLFNFNINNLIGTHTGVKYLIDSTQNNFQFKYDSLLQAGFNQNSAIAAITVDQSLNSSQVNMINGQYHINIMPNAVILLQFKIPELVTIIVEKEPSKIKLYPNPTSNQVYIQSENPIGTFQILNVNGQELDRKEIQQKNYQLDLNNYTNGLYFLNFIDMKETLKVAKE